MMAHTIAGTAALFDEDIQNHRGTIGAQFISYDRYGKMTIRAGSAAATSPAGRRKKPTTSPIPVPICSARSCTRT
jgi:hypothetical protein